MCVYIMLLSKSSCVTTVRKIVMFYHILGGHKGTVDDGNLGWLKNFLDAPKQIAV